MTPIYAGAHDASVLGVKSGDCDAGFAQDSMVDSTLIDKGDLKPGEIKTVWKSEMIAGSVFAANDSLGPEAIEKLETIFTEKANADVMEAEGFCQGDACLITDERAWGVVPAADWRLRRRAQGLRGHRLGEVQGLMRCQTPKR